MMFVYVLLFAAVTVGTRLGIHYWRPLTDDSGAWSVGIFAAAMICLLVASYRQDQKLPVEEKPEPRFQGTSPYDGGVIVGASAMAANIGLPGLVTNQGDSGGGSSGHSSCSHGSDGGGDCGGGGGH